MAVTPQIMSHTPLSGSGLSILTANKMRLFARWVEPKEERQTPVTKWLTRRSTPWDQPIIETGQSYLPFITTTLGAQAANNSTTLTFAATTYLKEGDVLRILPLYSGETTEYDWNNKEYATILTIVNGTQAVVNRHQGEVSSGSFATHASGSFVKVISRADNYNEPFGDAITYKGDSIDQYIQRFTSGEITYDLAAVKTGDYEAPNGHMMKDIMAQKEILPLMREAAFIEGRKVAPQYNATPQVPGQMMGMIQWAEQVSGNEYEVDGQINLFSFDDILRDKAQNHSDGPGDTMFGGYQTIAALDLALNEMKGNFGPNETTFTNKVTKLNYRWGSIEPRPVHSWPEGVILITSKGDWEWAHYEGMDWTYVERGPKELGAFQKSWTMGGDFSLVCKNASRQILMTGIDTRLNYYPGRQIFVTA